MQTCSQTVKKPWYCQGTQPSALNPAQDLAAVYVPASNSLANAQHQGIKGSNPYTLQNSGHGVFYDGLERFNEVFLYAIEEPC
jgi:hypothetical protein